MLENIRLIRFIFHLLVFISSNKTVKDLITSDVEMVIKKRRWTDISLYKALLVTLKNDKYYRTIFYLRIGRKSRFLRLLSPGSNSFFLNTNQIGGGIYLAHPFATFINAERIGRDFSCRQCTTIGNKTDGRNDLRPTIGNNVQVGANVVIIGHVNIGDNVIIGAGSVIVKDIESNSIVAGNPARVIRKIS
ncbi:serine acetyltransferase [Pedobacter faecalis]|uniref:serine acetyltransferase n=1 Tax=Pedobacter faecalis TaxID=3041495 RepID=UPI0033060ECF